jgi:hypothetical protein
VRVNRIEKQAFLNVKSVGSHRTFEDLELVRCEFTGANLAQFDDPEFNLVVRNVTATRCTVKRSGVQGVRFEEVLIDGLTTGSAPALHGCVFRHVTLRGRIGGLLFQPPNPTLPADVREAFTAGALRYYQDVDWAIDITEAEFAGDVNFFFVPGHLVRRDVETQYLLRRETFAGMDLGGFPLLARVAVERFEATPFDSIVAIAPKRDKTFFPKMKAAMDELRNAGLAE